MNWHEWLGKIVANTLFIAHDVENYINFVLDIITDTIMNISWG